MFKDYSTYLQTIVYLEKAAHELCNLKKYHEAADRVQEIANTANQLVTWLNDSSKTKSVEYAARLALDAIERGCSFDYFDNVIAPELKRALGEKS